MLFLFTSIKVIFIFLWKLFYELIHCFLVIKISLSLLPISLPATSGLIQPLLIIIIIRSRSSIRNTHRWGVSTLICRLCSLSTISTLTLSWHIFLYLLWLQGLVLWYYELIRINFIFFWAFFGFSCLTIALVLVIISFLSLIFLFTFLLFDLMARFILFRFWIQLFIISLSRII